MFLFFKRKNNLIKTCLYVVLFFFIFNSDLEAWTETFIFDCDGVLVDTEPLKFKSWQKAFANHGIEFTEQDYQKRPGLTSKEFVGLICREKEVRFVPSIVQEKKEIYKHLQSEGVQPMQSAVDFLKKLHQNKEKYNISIGLASADGRPEILRNLRQLGIETFFDVIISGQDDLDEYEDDEGKNKPKPYVYQKTMKLLGANPKYTVVFEDSQTGVQAAHSAGCHVIAIPTDSTATHNFDLASQIIQDFEELYLEDFFEKR